MKLYKKGLEGVWRELEREGVQREGLRGKRHEKRERKGGGGKYERYRGEGLMRA